jgi:hypothetical protein
MSLEFLNKLQPYQRLEDPEFVQAVRSAFVNLLEDRATDPESTGVDSARLIELAQEVQAGKKISDRIGLEILRGVFFSDDGALKDVDITSGEVERLWKIQFLKTQ